MNNFKSLKEINDSLRPCPLCGQKVYMTQIRQDAYGNTTANFECKCGLTAELEYFPPEVFMLEGSERNRLLPWEQWNRRYDDGEQTHAGNNKA